jgi:uncharacterized protein (DUF983 family)
VGRQRRVGLCWLIAARSARGVAPRRGQLGKTTENARYIDLSNARHITSICGASDARLTSFSTLSGRCPRCRQGHLYAGVLTIAPRCSTCGLDFAALDTGDGAIAIVVLILGAVAVTLAILTEILFAPPVWVHVVLWVPLVIAGAILLLRPLKAWLITQHYRRVAT